MIRVYAHRGASKQLPENTLEAFERALAAGADAIETDVHLTRDGHVVVSHDDSGHRMAGVDRAICECSLDEVKTWDMGTKFTGPRAPHRFVMPTLDELLGEFPNIVVNVDLKAPAAALVDATLAVVRAHRAEDRVQLASFHWRQLMRLRARRYRGTVGLSPIETVACLFAPAPMVRVLPTRGTIAQLPTASDYNDSASESAREWLDRVYQLRRALTPESALPSTPFEDEAGMVALFHDLGIEVDFWTVNDAVTARRLIDAGTDGIMTDDPTTIVPAVRGYAEASLRA